MQELELWGGHECTVNRVRGAYFDQTIRSGHHDRLDDLERFASLGLTSLRYPVLWERVAPDHPDRCDWRWTDERLARIRELRMRPILGLLHHGSGPRYTNLVDEAFPRLFATYARAAAERYAWADAWTPINEPLTTARFSALYGLWYPHLADEGYFWAALLNQIDGIRLAMAEIRAVNPAAQLIQTEDLGRAYGTRRTAEQVTFENARRWLTWDLLDGRVTPDHPLFERLAAHGFADRLRAIADEPCPADVIGVNHYLTSDRFLDDRVDAYPPERHGGNGEIAYADVEAIRVALPAPGGLEGALEEAWARYGAPLAVTESHNGCTREEQVRWVREGWETAQRLRARGVDVRAVTAWALLGSFDWNTLLTRSRGHYEVGAFDVRARPLRETALAAQLRALGARDATPAPGTEGPGWWRRDIRLEFRPAFRVVDSPEPRTTWSPPAEAGRPLLITGATGTLGRAVARACEWRGIAYRLTSRADMALDDEAAIARQLDETQAWAVINTAGWVRVDDAETAADACHAANAEGAIRLARACAERGLPFVGYSSDLVFDGAAGRLYVESDPLRPLNVYGESKARAEREILQAHDRALMIRTAAFFSPYDPYNFAWHLVRELAAGRQFLAAEDLVISPTYVPDLVDATLDLLIDGDTGLRHLVNAGAVTWAEFGQRLASALELDAGLVRGIRSASFGWPAARPAYAPLGTERGQIMPTLENAVARWAAVMREAEFAGEAEARADRAHPDLIQRAAPAA